MASIDETTANIENMKKELQAMTGSVPNPNYDPSKPAGPGNRPVLVGEFSCAKLQELISAHVQQITNVINQKAASASSLMSEWAPILSVPSNPLKIIKWAIKVATGPAGLAVEKAIQQIRSMVKLIVAVAELAAAIAQAAAQLVACLESTIQQAINDVIRSVFDNAADLMTQAESIVDGIMAKALEDSGIQDLIDQVDGEGGITDSFRDLIAAGETARTARDIATGIRRPTIYINIPGGFT